VKRRRTFEISWRSPTATTCAPSLRRVRVSAGLRRQVPGHHCAQRDPDGGTILDDGSLETGEEKKLRDESRKILEIPGLLVDATCVRVPVFTGHSLAITASSSAHSRLRSAELLETATGVVVCELPMPRLAAGKDPCYVGRIRRAETVVNGLSMFIKQ